MEPSSGMETPSAVLAGRVAIVTGAARGIRRAIAEGDGRAGALMTGQLLAVNRGTAFTG